MKNPENFFEKCSIHRSYCKRVTDKGFRNDDEFSCADCEWYEIMDEDGCVLDEYDTDEGVDFNYGEDNW